MSLYRDVLEIIPTAVAVVDKTLRVQYANRAFRLCFRTEADKGALRDVISCREDVAVCGKDVKCAYCSMRSFLLEAIKSGRPAFRKLIFRRDEDFALRMKVVPMEENFLVLIDNVYETELAREMSSAQDIQQRLLPPAESGAPYSFMYIPCREIGGDLPDVYSLHDDTMGVLADVSGKGISAGMLSAFVRAGWDRSEPSPAKAIFGLNAKFQELNPDERSYVTVAAVRIDKKNGLLHYCAAGHNAPILLKSAHGIDEIVMSAPPVSTWIPDFRYEDGAVPFEKGNLLVLLTDGVTESRNARGEEFSLERVEEILRRSADAQRFIERLKADLKEFCGTFSDDITAIAFDL